MAYESRGKPLHVLLHTNQGTHYIGRAFQQQLWLYQCRPSMSRGRNCWNNAPLERFFRSYKPEWMPSEAYGLFDQAAIDIAGYVKHYNHVRGRSYYGYLSPAAAEAA